MSEWLEVSELKTMLRALADEARLNIVHHLAGQGEVNVTEICQSLDIKQPLVSWHLAMLRRAGLVRRRRLGRQVYCSLDLARFQRCQQWLASLIEPGASAPDTANLELQGERVQP
ncbi:MAG TPA: metalloregulator ArsR/SmtB family transcription factor [Ktedonobacterales bacterium]|jgi:ArsR family transcriptional regulator